MDREKEDLIIEGIVYRFLRAYGKTWWVSQNGIIRGGRSKKVISQVLDEYGYYKVWSVRVHRLVGLAWVDGWFEGAEINHKDFNRENNDYTNLEWVTHQQNVTYSVENNSEVWNKSKQGTNNGRATFTEEKVLEIRKLYDAGMQVSDILKLDHPELDTVKKYKSLHSTYLNICKRKTWKNI